ncbi:hypothetical protein JX265_006731 [Neoarthrinium moseri]|uniref:Heterokaryon incompatibility domain-containing protein n=1 Tax=Neoarthrinium moseri TaxID=1658444 RepID=A0A9P9WL27_9PEZI|nr:hypothetical protein JX265_006731 [Neoarthrinium moseri]
MRLLNVKTLRLEEYITHEVPRYSILSHRWEDQEVTFQNLTSGQYRHLRGWQKILGCCKVSRQEGFTHTWIDSCCIDKSSSAELSEAINSMFMWYQNAGVCYVYLSDVSSISDFSRSQWFTRGWSLQELIAPDVVVFLDSNWREMGSKASLMPTVSNVTGIDEGVLGSLRPRQNISDTLRQQSVASKLSWAASRTTTRIEDGAYCLLGLFDVNMPLLYGEGEKAFRRLQREIMNESDDESIFCWAFTDERFTGSFTGLLAGSPRVFKGLNDMRFDRELQGSVQNEIEISKNRVQMHVSTLGTPRSHAELLFSIRRVLDPRVSLFSTAYGEDGRDLKVFDAVISVLQCRVQLGRVVLLLVNNESGSFTRYHFDGHLYFIEDCVSLPPPQKVQILLERRRHQDAISPIPSVRMVSRVSRLGYRLWATSTAIRPDSGQKHTWWLEARGGRGFLLFENRHQPKWLSCAIFYQYEPNENHLKLHFGSVDEDFMPDDAKAAALSAEYRDIRELSQLNSRQKSGEELVLKVRMHPHWCELILVAKH